ncbi:MAG: dihydrofolate reductase [Alphaproteobacteria bacterium]|nr:dihydrofolate reductase [Alphaproteobacteria bacterium]
MSPIISLVVARAENGVIGNRGRLPWRIPEDLKHFRAVTMGNPCIMGRKTWESLPKKPLPGRTNIVVTRDKDFGANGATIVHSFNDALTLARAEFAEEIAVIGGAAIFREALPLACRIHLTEVHATFEGDAIMPVLKEIDWRESWREDHPAHGPDNPAFSFVTLERR